MSDVFLSYSRKDSRSALAFAERLRDEGFSPWVDQTGIHGAEKWSAEIVDALEMAKVVILLVSQASNSSPHVHREIALASELEKHILPVEIEPVALSRELKYPLAGLHRLPIADLPSIVRSLEKLGVPQGERPEPAVPTFGKKDAREALMVLPFEDLSPNEDNSWFSDGLTGELIHALANIRSLRLIDRNTAMEYKGARGKTSDIARELDVRYFLEGQVRKFGTEIKISAELLDIETGDHIWNMSHKGSFSDIFDVQEEVAKKVVE
ncbi:MAG TPA: TIR domain-containing protein, partial [Candidatus Kapabacteria bacterium]